MMREGEIMTDNEEEEELMQPLDDISDVYLEFLVE